jgi:flagellin-like protein
MQKGISPIISAVVLIAATMSVAGVLAFWAANFVGVSSPQTASTFPSLSTCQTADFQIYQCSYSSSSKIISFVLYNLRTVDMSGMSATVFDSNSLPAWSNITLGANLPVGQFVSYTITGIPSNFTKLAVTTFMCPSIMHDTTCTRS